MGPPRRHGYDVDPERVFSWLAGRQDGVVSRRQLLGAAIDGKWIDRRIAVGRLIVIYRGVYAVGHAALSDRGRIRAGLLAAGSDALASHTTAAYLDELIPSMPAVVEVTVTARARRSRPGLVIHETSRAPERRWRDGIPLTAPLRTLADLKATRPAAEVERAAIEALVRRRVTKAQLEAAGLGGVEMTRSKLERDLLRIVSEAGLPAPLVNHRVGRYEVDFAWPDHRVIVETDGYAAHGHRRAFEDDRSRDAALQAAGWRVLRFTHRQLGRHPLNAAARLAQVLGPGSVAA
jgi:very-short-patch-repair endonuclease